MKKTAGTLLQMLFVSNYTRRHLDEINDFIQSGESDVKVLLNKLGKWDEADLAIAERWIKLPSE